MQTSPSSATKTAPTESVKTSTTSAATTTTTPSTTCATAATTTASSTTSNTTPSSIATPVNSASNEAVIRCDEAPTRCPTSPSSSTASAATSSTKNSYSKRALDADNADARKAKRSRRENSPAEQLSPKAEQNKRKLSEENSTQETINSKEGNNKETSDNNNSNGATQPVINSNNGVKVAKEESLKVPPLKICLQPPQESERQSGSSTDKMDVDKKEADELENTLDKETGSSEPKKELGEGSSVTKEETGIKVEPMTDQTDPQRDKKGRTSHEEKLLASSLTFGESSTGRLTRGRHTNNSQASMEAMKEDEDGGKAKLGECEPAGTSAGSKMVLLNEEAGGNSEYHVKKRKLRSHNMASSASSSSLASRQQPKALTPQQQQQLPLNDIQKHLEIRRQVEQRRKNLFPVQPKPPQGFKDYLMNKKTYLLQSNQHDRLRSMPVLNPPPSLEGALKTLFIEQEQQRVDLRKKHLVEKEKLVLAVEQEILRVHGRAARALANQSLPFSVCTILKDEEIYTAIDPGQDEKNRDIRSRYNGRLFLSWLQDVDDKWEKIKEQMVLRHHNEAESLNAVQKLDWEWKVSELNLDVAVDELNIPMVHVSDDFDLSDSRP